jgi:serine/threonine protein kinase
MEEALLPTSASELKRESSALAPGAMLQSRYRIVRQLGRGGMGAVYEAVDQRLEATVALKETFSVDDRLRRQFEQEARLLAQLHHPALPRVSDYFTEDGRAFLVMQFISGADLAETISQQPGPFPRNLVIVWADQLLDALIYLHTRDRQIIHRDIKPHNLKLTSSGQIALLDFGLAKAQPEEASTASSSDSIFGYTRRYSPLEQIQDQGTTPRSDIYALGATLYHLLTGVKPHDALTRAAALAKSKNDPLRPAHEIHPAVGPEIAAILCRAMALSAEDRYRTASEFREALRQIGRETREAKNSVGASTARASSGLTAGTTMAKKERLAVFDPFGSYAILKPDEIALLIPKPSRRPAAIAAVVAISLVVGFGIVFDFGSWIESTGSMMDYARAAPSNGSTGAPVVPQSKSDSSRLKVSGIKNVSIGSIGEISRKNETQKRRTPRADSSHPKTPVLHPSPLSITR